LGLRVFLEALGAPLGFDAEHAIGLPVGIDLRWAQHADGLLVAGVVTDLAQQLAESAGATFDPSAPALWVADVDRRGVAPHRIDTGPAAFAVEQAGARPVALVPGSAAASSELEQAGQLRRRLEAAAERLTAGLQVEPDVDALVRLTDEQPDYSARAFDDVAESRRLLGRYLVDAGDRFDDERLDQLGDAYMNVAPRWAELVDAPQTVTELFADERTYAGWTASAAQQPTRYAF
jgi:hypothetical protein